MSRHGPDSFGRRLEGRRVLVMGAGGSLGAAAADRLAAEGADLVLTGRDLGRLAATRDQVSRHGGGCEVIGCDVTDRAAWDALVERIGETGGDLHGFVNFSAVLSRAGLTETAPEDWDTIIAANLTGAWLGMRSVVPLLVDAGGGAVVNIGSIDALVGRGASAAYAASKGGLRALTKSAAMQYADRQVRINSVHPAPMETRVQHMIGPSDPGLDVEALLAALIAQIPLGRLGAAEDVAAAVAFLLSDDAAFVTGVDLPVDGGYTAH